MAQGNRDPVVGSGHARASFVNGENGNRGAAAGVQITFTKWRLKKAGEPYTVTVGGVDYTLYHDDQWMDVE